MEQLSVSRETLAAQALGEVDPVSGGLAPSISLSTNFEQLPDGSYRQNRVYTRADNPTYEHAERLLAALEGGGCGCAVFASGMAVTTSAVMMRVWVAPFATAPTVQVRVAGSNIPAVAEDDW